MFRGVTTLGLLVGLIIGFPAGMAYAVGRRAWRDLSGAKKIVGGARKSAWSASRLMVAWLVGLTVLVVAAVAWASGGNADQPCAQPSAPPAAHAAVGGDPAASPSCAPQ